MQNFNCTGCNARVDFENISCLACARALAFSPDMMSIVALDPNPKNPAERRLTAPPHAPVRYCGNWAHGACNWLASPADADGLCIACGMNRVIPNIASRERLQSWRDLELAKKRLIYSLLRLQLPFELAGTGSKRLTFDFADGKMTGHKDGVITINPDEADTVERERRRQWFDEPYRSLLGHMRHESGHFFWELLVSNTANLDNFRKFFGDERLDYKTSLANYHHSGPAPNWHERHASAYASAHPWEDWAETWAHYLHMLSVLDTAEAEGISPTSTQPSGNSDQPQGAIPATAVTDVYRKGKFESLVNKWVPLTITMNALSRSMGHSDFYPFVTPPPVYEKLQFIHDIIRARPQSI